jgi:hypothetical protein
VNVRVKVGNKAENRKLIGEAFFPKKFYIPND